jgi:hypothetical protein
MSKIDVSNLNAEEVIKLQKELNARKKEVVPSLTVNAKNNKIGLERHITSALQCVRVLVKEGAFDASKEYVDAQLARLDPEKLVKNAMKVPERSLRGRAAIKAREAAEAAEAEAQTEETTENETAEV